MTEPSPTTPTSSGPSRRQLLRGGAAVVAGVGVAATLSACAGGSEGGAAAGPRTLDNPVSVPKDEVPVGSGVIRPDDRLVVTQPTEGEFHAFSAVCPHQGCLVSMIRNDAIVCACHTSLFALDDGSLISGPARAGLPALQVTEDGDDVRVG